nr:IclR family transcriptional regulator [Massilia sp. JS1662]
MATDRSLSVLKLFTLDRPVWTAEDIARTLDVSMSTAYRYVLALEDVGLVTTASPGRYILGPAIIQLDRQLQLTDPLLAAARPVMDKITQFAPDGSVVLLCRSFSETVLCMHQVHTKGPQPMISYERGRPMPMFKGASSRIILANQAARHLRKMYDEHADEVRDNGDGTTWDEFRAAMTKLRKTGYAVSFGEVDRGRIGIAAPLLDEARHPIGSLSYVVQSSLDQSTIPMLASVVTTAAREVEDALRSDPRDGSLRKPVAARVQAPAV